MSRSLAMQFGSSGMAKNIGAGMKLIDSGLITDATVITFTPDAGSMYLLCTREFNASTGANRGFRIICISVPEVDVYGTVAVGYINVVISSNTGVTISYPSDSTVTLKRSSATYAFRYAIYKVL